LPIALAARDAGSRARQPARFFTSLKRQGTRERPGFMVGRAG